MVDGEGFWFRVGFLQSTVLDDHICARHCKHPLPYWIRYIPWKSFASKWCALIVVINFPPRENFKPTHTSPTMATQQRPVILLIPLDLQSWFDEVYQSLLDQISAKATLKRAKPQQQLDKPSPRTPKQSSSQTKPLHDANTPHSEMPSSTASRTAPAQPSAWVCSPASSSRPISRRSLRRRVSLGKCGTTT